MLFWINAAIDILLVFFVIDCVLMCLVVLMQRSKQEGLGAAFGGGFTESVWGAQTSQVLVRATCWLAGMFFVFSIALDCLYAHRSSLQNTNSTLQQELLKPVAPAVSHTVVTPASPATAATSVPVPPPTPAPAVPVKPAAK